MNRTLRKQEKEAQASEATEIMERQSALVRDLTKQVNKGLAPRVELEQAVIDLARKGRRVEILSAETKMLSDWTLASDNEVLPESPSKLPSLLVAIGLLLVVAKLRSR